MSGTVIVAGARTPIGRLLGGLKALSAADLGGVAIKGALEQAGRRAGPGRLRDHGPGHPGRRRPDPRPQAGVAGGIPMTVPALTINKVCLSGPERDRAGRPADPRRRVRDRRRRRHGVDDQRPAPAAEVARGLQVRRHHAGRLDGLRRALRPVRPAGDGRADRGLQRPHTELTREEQDAFAAALAPAGRRGLEERRLRRRDRPGLDPAAQGRPGRGHRRRGRPRRHHRRVARRPAPGVPQGRHDHRRLGLADLRRRLRGRGDEQGQGRGARAGVAGRDRRPRRGRRPRLDPAAAAGQRHRSWPATRRASRPPTSTWSRSTRRSPRSASTPPASSASTSRRSTSTAARSRSATRSACPAPGSCCTWRWSSSAAAAASARPRCAAAAARATP